jgi:hypothetical protein
MHSPADLTAAMSAIQDDRAEHGLPAITSGSELHALAETVLDAVFAAAPPAGEGTGAPGADTDPTNTP